MAGFYDVGRLVATLGLNTTPFTAGLAGADSAMRKFGAGAMLLGRTMTRFVTIPMALAGGAAVATQKDFEASMTKIVSLVGVAREAVDEWTEAVLRMAPAVGRGPNELADALFFITSAGIRGAEAMEVLEMSAKAAAVGLGETKVVADLVTSAMNAYGKENLSAAEATDILVAAVREGKAQADELASSMGKVLPIASAFGVEFDQVGAAFAAMTRTGTNADIAATQLKAILSQMASPSEQAADAMASVGTSAEEFRRIMDEDGLIEALLHLRDAVSNNQSAFADVFPNIRALMGVLDLLGKNIDDNIDIFESLANASGSLSTAFEEVRNTTQFKLQASLAALKVLLTDVGDALAGPVSKALTGIISKLETTIEWFNQFNETQKLAILRMGGFAAAIGPVLLLMSRLVQIIITSPWVALATVVLAASVALAGFLSVTKNASGELIAQKRVMDRATASIADQRAKVKALYDIAKDENQELETRKKAIQELNRISPTYLGNLNTENIATKEAVTALDDYNKNLLTKARIQAASELLVETEKKILKLTNGELKDQIKPFRRIAYFIAEGASGLGLSGAQLAKNELAAKDVNNQLRIAREEYAAYLEYIKTGNEELLKGKTIIENTSDAVGGSDDTVKRLGYIAKLEKAIEDKEAEIRGARKEQLPLLNRQLEALQQQLNAAHNLRVGDGVRQKILEGINALEAEKRYLSGEELARQNDIIKALQHQLDLLDQSTEDMGELQSIELRIAEIEILRAKASGEVLDNLNKQLESLKKQKDVIEDRGTFQDEPPLTGLLNDWKEYYAKKAKWAEESLRKEEITQYEHDQIIADSIKGMRDKRVQAAQDWLTITSNAAQTIGTIIETQKQRELSAVGDNAQKREEIEREFFKKQKAMSIAQAIVNGALAVTNLIANVPGSVINPATWVGIGLSAAMTAAQVGLIAAQDFAQGGLVYGETLARVGEYPGAHSNPEVIAPLKDLSKFIQPNMAVPKEVELRVKGGGRSLYAVLHYEQVMQNTY